MTASPQQLMIVNYYSGITGASVLAKWRYCHTGANNPCSSSTRFAVNKPWDWAYGPGYDLAFKTVDEFWEFAKRVGYGDRLYMASFPFAIPHRVLSTCLPLSERHSLALAALRSVPRAVIRDRLVLSEDPFIKMWSARKIIGPNWEDHIPEKLSFPNGVDVFLMNADTQCILNMLNLDSHSVELPAVAPVNIMDLGGPAYLGGKIRVVDNWWNGNKSTTKVLRYGKKNK